jgi:predicted nucleic acid-binding protein
MRLVDSSAWIEWLEGSPFGELVAKELPPRDQWLVPTIVQFELTKWVMREGGEDKIDEIIALTEVCVVADLDTSTALLAAEVSGKHQLAAADAIIYATARTHDADLLTCDRHFEGLPGVLYIPKLKS